MSLSATELVLQVLGNPYDVAAVRPLLSDDFVYVSLNYENDELKRIMPWCGTSQGAESLVKAFTDVRRFWAINTFSIDAAFGRNGNVAVFGRFTYTSTVLSKTVTSPFAVFAKVTDGKCDYMQFMEDTMATAASFRASGSWTFQSDPGGPAVVI